MSDHDDKLTRIEDKIDGINDHLGEMNVTLGKQEVSLAIHIKRTKMLEDRVAPLERHASMMDGAIKLIGILAALAAVYEIFK